MDLCSLLQTMKLDERQVSDGWHLDCCAAKADIYLRKEWGSGSDSRSCPKAEVHLDDEIMLEDPNYQVRFSSACSAQFPAC